MKHRIKQSERDSAMKKAADGWLYSTDLAYSFWGFRGARFTSWTIAIEHARHIISTLANEGLIRAVDLDATPPIWTIFSGVARPSDSSL
jgi:hypothetical protein